MLRAHWSFFIKFIINKNYTFNRIRQVSIVRPKKMPISFSIRPGKSSKWEENIEGWATELVTTVPYRPMLRSPSF
jgi:hypothetical protein